MKLIVDSGSTKTDWLFFEGNLTVEIQTIGYNPMTTNSQDLIDDFKKQSTLDGQKISEIYFYGAGCSTPTAIAKTASMLEILFPKGKIQVDTDLMAAAHATSHGKASIVCILGTGSNSCLFDGTKIIDQIPNLGYLLGDEGAGFAVGKEVLRAFFYRELSPELTVAFQDKYQLSRNELITKIYQTPTPNKEIAAFAKFAVENREQPHIQVLITKVFQDFVERHLLKYYITSSIPIHFVGTIVYIFRNKMEEILERNNLTRGNILRKPIEGLRQYHQTSRQ